MQPQVKEAAPLQWSNSEAHISGKRAFQIKVEMSGNPFKLPDLREAWESGWKKALSEDTYTARRVDYAPMEDRHRGKRPNPRFGNKDDSR